MPAPAVILGGIQTGKKLFTSISGLFGGDGRSDTAKQYNLAQNQWEKFYESAIWFRGLWTKGYFKSDEGKQRIPAGMSVHNYYYELFGQMYDADLIASKGSANTKLILQNHPQSFYFNNPKNDAQNAVNMVLVNLGIPPLSAGDIAGSSNTDIDYPVISDLPSLDNAVNQAGNLFDLSNPVLLIGAGVALLIFIIKK